MSYTRDQIRTRVQRRLDAVGATRWDTTAGNTGEQDQLISDAFDKEWRRILSHAPMYRYGKRAVTTHATTGRVAISGLNSGSGDTLERLFRVLGVVVGTIPYEEVQFKRWMLAEDLGISAHIWWREGDNMMLLPKALSTAVTVHTNHIPVRIADLSLGTIAVTFPDGYEEVPVLEATADLLMKGGAEIDTTRLLRQEAEVKRQDMLQDLSRFSTKPMRMEYDDDPVDWGG